MPDDPAPVEPRRYAPYYPWSAWFASGDFVLVRGVDFTCKVHGMLGMLRNKARRLGYSVSIKMLDDDSISVKTRKVPRARTRN